MQLYFADRQVEHAADRLVITDPEGRLVPLSAARQSGRRVLLCMYGPDVELLAASARRGSRGRRRAAESAFPAGSAAVVEHSLPGRAGRESAVLVSSREILREYRRLLPEATLLAPSSILLALAGAEPAGGGEELMILAAGRWFTLLRPPRDARGQGRLEVRSDCVESPSELPGALRRALDRLAVADEAAGAGAAGASRRISAFALGGGAGSRLAEALPDTPVREIPALLPDLIGRLHGDFPSCRRRSRRIRSLLGALAALPLLGALPGLPLPLSPGAERVGSDRALPVPGAVPARVTAVSGAAGPSGPGRPQSSTAPRSTARPVAPSAPAAGDSPRRDGENDPSSKASAGELPAERFHFAGRGRDAEGRAIWYFVDGETRRVITVPGREDSYDPTVRN